MPSLLKSLIGEVVLFGNYYYQQGDPLEQLLALFEGAGDEVALRTVFSGTAYTYNFYQNLGERRYYNTTLSGTVTAGGEFVRITRKRISLLCRGYGNAETTHISYAGSWTTVVDTAQYKGSWRYSSTNGAYAELTTLDGTEWVGANIVTIANGGMAKVTIDGDATLADLLPTAQDLVTLGTLDSTALVANGGTLSPTDRIWNQYNAGADVLFTKSLTPGVHTVRIARTGYKQAASSGTFVTVTSFFAGGSTIRTVTEAPTDAYFVQLQRSFGALSQPVDEISYETTPTGAGAGEWIGHTGSLKFTILPTVTVDGVSDTPTNWELLVGQDIRLAMQFGARHTFTGATNIALMDIEYRMNAVTGFWIAHTLTWDAGFTGETYGYPAMMALDDIFDMCRSMDTVATALTDDDDENAINTRLDTVWMWDADGNQGALMHIPDLATTVNNWDDAQTGLEFFVKDIASGAWKKAYATRIYPFPYIQIAGGEIWESEVNYRVQWFADANAELADV